MAEPLTYANAQPDLLGGDFAAKLRALRIARTFAETSAAKEQDNEPTRRRTASIPHMRENLSMVARERPFPAPRPSLPFAADVDAASFDARWEAERRRAAQSHPTPSTQGDTPMTDKDQTDTTRRPEETLRDGPLKAAIWRNEGDYGAYHSVTLARTYKDRDGNLQDTTSFRAKDMLGLSELARRAHHEAHERDRAAFKEQRQEQAAPAKTRKQSRSR